MQCHLSPCMRTRLERLKSYCWLQEQSCSFIKQHRSEVGQRFTWPELKPGCSEDDRLQNKLTGIKHLPPDVNQATLQCLDGECYRSRDTSGRMFFGQPTKYLISEGFESITTHFHVVCILLCTLSPHFSCFFLCELPAKKPCCVASLLIWTREVVIS